MMETRSAYPDLSGALLPTVKLRHYSGGDALWDEESTVVSWLTNLDCSAKIPLVKLSHHGACESTPIDMLEQMNPDFMVITNSSGAGRTARYGHPREFLFIHSGYPKLTIYVQGGNYCSTCMP